MKKVILTKKQKTYRLLWKASLTGKDIREVAKQLKITDENLDYVLKYTSPEIMLDKKDMDSFRKYIQRNKNKTDKLKLRLRSINFSSSMMTAILWLYSLIVIPILGFILYVLYV